MRLAPIDLEIIYGYVMIGSRLWLGIAWLHNPIASGLLHRRQQIERLGEIIF
jgi:hypothetical protein